MSLLLVEGFEGCGTITGIEPQPVGVLSRQYITYYSHDFDLYAGRFGGYSLDFTGNPNFWAVGLTTNDTLIVGLAFRKNSSLRNGTFLRFYDGATEGIQLYITTTGTLRVYRGGALLGESAPVLVDADTWYYVELKIKCHNSAGTYEVRVGGSNVLSGSGVDTQIGANAYYDNVKFSSVHWTMHIIMDDIYICDGFGSINNDFLGPCRVVSVFPDGDDTAGWDTASGGSDHYLDVDENPADDNTTYVEDNTSGHKDLYDYATMSIGIGDIKGLSIKTQCRETDANNFSLITPIKSGAAESDDSAQSIGSTDYVIKTRISETDPNTLTAWTETTVNAAKFGVKVG